MTSGLIGLIFKETLSEEEIQKMVSEFYKKHRDGIEGMQYLEFADPKTLDQVLEFINSTDSKNPFSFGYSVCGKGKQAFIQTTDRFVQGTVAALDVVAIYDQPQTFKDIVMAGDKEAILKEIKKNGTPTSKKMAKSIFGE